MKKLEKIKFVRFGGLSPHKQQQYNGNEERRGFYSPPVKYGFYAFPEHHIEYFYIGGDLLHPTHVIRKTEWIRDDNGKLIEAKLKEHHHNVSWKDALVDELKDYLNKQKIRLKYVRYFRKSQEKFMCKCKEKMELDSLTCKPPYPNHHFFESKCLAYRNSPFYLAYLKKPKKIVYTGNIWHHWGDFCHPNEINFRVGHWVNNYLEALNKARHYALRNKHKKDNKKSKLYASSCSLYNWEYRDYDDYEVFIERV